MSSLAIDQNRLAPPPAPVALVAGQDRSPLEGALATVLEARGAGGVRFVELGANDDQQWCVGAALRMTSDDGQVQDYALFATLEAAPEFVRWMFGFRGDRVLDDATLLDGLGETLNQLVGRIKEQWLEVHDSEPVLDTPRVLGADGCALYLATHPQSQRTEVIAEPWRRGLHVAVSPLQDPALCALDEVLGLLDCADGDDAVLARAQAGLAGVREHLVGEIRVTAQVVLTSCTDQITALINGVGGDSDRVVNTLHALREQVAAACRRDDFLVPSDSDLIGLLGEFVEEAQTVLDAAQRELDGEGPHSAHGLFRAMHTVKGNAGFFGLEQMQRLAHSTESMLAQVRDRDLPLDEGHVRATRRSVALLRDFVTRLSERLECGARVPYQRAVDLHRAVIDAAVLGGTSPVIIESSGGREAAVKREAPMVRVAEVHLDSLELIEQNFAEVVARFAGGDVGSELAILHQRLSATCRSLRRVGLDRLLGKVRRLCSETAEHLGKLVQVEVFGEDIDVPRHLATALSGPLVHLARNAIDHGIEEPEERRGTGKPLLATVGCRAAWHGAWLVVELSEDGRGVDPDRVRAKAIRAGLVAEGDEISPSGILDLLMSPGFSTAVKTTNLSGRGVGLDVVRREIEGAGGRVELTSTFGQGSTFRILLPEGPDAPPFESQTTEPASEDLELADDGELTFF